MTLTVPQPAHQDPNDHAIVRVTDAGIYYRASALGGCFRALWAARNEHPPKDPPDAMQAIFDRGHEIEDIVLDRLVAEGWNIYDRQREIIIPMEIATDPPCFIVGHIDALGAPPEGLFPDEPESHLFEHVIEVKGFGKSLMDKWRLHGFSAFPRYKIQAGAYLRGIPCGDLLMAIYEKDTEQIHFSHHPDLGVEAWQLEAIVLSVEECFKTGQIPSCTNEYPCPYYYLHDPKETPMPLDPTQDTFVTAYLALSEQIKLLTDARTVVSNQLKDSINYVDGAPTSYDSSKAIVVITANPQSLDRPKIFELLTAAGEDPDNYLLPSTGFHLRINPKKERPVDAV